jgi:amino acid transporter
MTATMEVTPPPVRTGRQGLRAGAIGALSVGVMAAAFAAPSTSIFFNSPFVASFAGKAMVAAFLFSAIVIGLVALNIAAFSTKLPSSGYAYTYVSHGLGSEAGFVSAWMTLLVFIGTPIILPPVFGTTMRDLVDSLIGVSIPWEIFAVALLVLVGTLAVVGISDSLKVGGVFVVIELGAVTAFAIYMLIKSPHAQSPASLTPTSAPSLGGFAVAMIFGILSFQGFESAATLGEETRDSTRSVARALLGAILVLGIFYIVASYGAIVGWGSGDVSGYGESASPFIELAHRYAGSWLADVFSAVVGAGLLAGTIAGTNACARMLFAMGRDRVLPGWLSTTSARTQTPIAAVLLVVTGGGVLGIAVAAAWTPTKLWGFMGSIISLGAILVYILVSAGVAPFFAREHRSELSLLRHVGIPAVAVAALTVPLWIKNGLLWPAPAHPYNLVPYLTLSWLAIGVAIVLYLRVRRPADLRSAGRIVLDPTP